MTLCLALFRADQSSGALDRFAFLRRWSRFFMSFRIAGDNHLGFVSSLIRFRLTGAFASMASLRREYQPFTMSSTSSNTKIASHGAYYGGPYLPRQNVLFHGKTYFSTAKLTFPRQNLLFHGKTYFSTAKLTFPRQNLLFHGKTYFPTAKLTFPRQNLLFHGKTLLFHGKTS